MIGLGQEDEIEEFIPPPAIWWHDAISDHVQSGVLSFFEGLVILISTHQVPKTE